MVTGDPVRLEQVFVNLLANAAKYTPPGGEIGRGRAAARRRDRGDASATPASASSAERLTRVFELFDQGGRDLARTQGGLGIGLTIVRGLVELHGGSVEARSAGPGRGSEFVVTPPGSGRGRSRGRDARRHPRGSCCRVLVVDDHVDAGAMLGVLLAPGGTRWTW